MGGTVFWNGIKTLLEKKKMLVTSIFFFSNNIFNSHKIGRDNSFAVNKWSFSVEGPNFYSLQRMKILFGQN